jgi:hypothetical protein
MTPIRRPGESAAEALRRLERAPDYLVVIETDAGQALLREAHRAASEARRYTAKAAAS